MQLAQGWSVAVDRGPDWLFLTLKCDDDSVSEPVDLAENLWELGRCHLVNRIVLDLHELPSVTDALLYQLRDLRNRIHKAQGVLRLCGLEEEANKANGASKLNELFSCYDDRDSAVRGERPPQPR